MARTSIREAPEPKAARVTGAYTPGRRAPNWLRTAGVATTRSDPSGSPRAGDSTSSRPAGTPCACRAAHMAGSQATMASAPAWRATQAAACCRAAAAAPSAEVPACWPASPPGPPARDNRTVAAPATKTTATSAATSSTRQRARAGHNRRIRPSRRRVHSRRVVMSTVPQDGSRVRGTTAGVGSPDQSDGSGGQLWEAGGRGSPDGSGCPGGLDCPAGSGWPEGSCFPAALGLLPAPLGLLPAALGLFPAALGLFPAALVSAGSGRAGGSGCGGPEGSAGRGSLDGSAGRAPPAGTGRLAYLDGTDGLDASGVRLGSSDCTGGGLPRGSRGLGRSGGSASPGRPGRGTPESAGTGALTVPSAVTSTAATAAVPSRSAAGGPCAAAVGEPRPRPFPVSSALTC